MKKDRESAILEEVFEDAYSNFLLQKYEQSRKLFIECTNLVNRSNLFSMNETLSDLSTKSIIYLSVFHFIGCCYFKENAIWEARLENLEKAESAYKVFLEFCDSYGIFNTKDREFGELLGVIVSVDESKPRKSESAAVIRLNKIEALKREKKLESSFRQYLDTKNNENFDEDYVRDLCLNSIKYMILKTLQDLESIGLEQQLLKMRQVNEQTGNEPKVSIATTKTRTSGALIGAQGKILRPFILTNSRDQIIRQTFKSSHILPTMTIDEYIEEEIKRNGIITSRRDEKKIFEDEDKDNEAETYRLREWDSFTDDNPRGSGNRLANRG